MHGLLTPAPALVLGVPSIWDLLGFNMLRNVGCRASRCRDRVVVCEGCQHVVLYIGHNFYRRNITTYSPLTVPTLDISFRLGSCGGGIAVFRVIVVLQGLTEVTNT